VDWLGGSNGVSVGDGGLNKLSDELSYINPEALLADGLEDAFVGYTLNYHHAHVAIYDYGKCVQILVNRDGMTEEEAEECLEFNTLSAYVGENGPLYVVMEE
jgi:hypothetical protein